MGKRLLLIGLLFTAALLRTGAQALGDGPYRQLREFPFVIVSDDAVTTPPVITDSLFDAAARGLRFKVNSTQLQPQDSFLALYRDVLVPWLKSQDLELRRLYVRGAASPEGPYANNVRLSRGRTRQLATLLCGELGQSADGVYPLDEKSITEDYGLLVKLMAGASDPDYSRVKAIWDHSGGDEPFCKRELMALDGGKVWTRLLKEYFPALRQARVIMWFARKPEAAPKVYAVKSEAPVFSLPAAPLPALVYRQPVPLPEEESRRHLIAARTNLLHDLLYVPQFGFAPGGNLQLEYYPLDGHYTYNIGFTFIHHRRWSQHKFMQIRDLQFELRRYFKGGGKFIGPYLGAYVHGTVYGIGFSKSKGWEGEGLGGGLSGGYTFRLNRSGSLRMELSLSLGVFYSPHDPYVYGNPITGKEDGLYYYDYLGNTSEFKPRNHRFTWWGPTNVGVQITYDIIYRKWKPVGSYNMPYQTRLKKGGGR